MCNPRSSSAVPPPRSWLKIGAVVVPLIAGLLTTTSNTVAEQGTEVKVTVHESSGRPMADVEIVLQPLDGTGHPITARAPFTRKTDKKGVAFFPFLPYNGTGFGRHALTINQEGFYINKFKIVSRQLQSAGDEGIGTLIQSDESTMSARQQQPLSVTAKPSGRVVVDLTLAPKAAQPSAGPTEAAAEAAGGSKAPLAGPGAAQAAEGKAPAAPADPLIAAKALAAQGKFSEAEAAIRALAEAKPEANYDFELARIYHAEEKSDLEKAALLKALSKDPSYPGAHYMLGKIAYQDGLVSEAVAQIQAEMLTHPDDSVSQATLGMIYSEAGKKADAIRMYEGIVSREPSNADALVALARLFAAEGDLKKSEETYAKVVALDPGKADQVYFKVGQAIADQRDLSESERLRAVDAFKKAIELNPKHAKAHRELGYALIGLGRMEEAKEQFKSYLDLTPNAADAATIRQFIKGT